MAYQLEAGSSGIYLLFDNSHVINTVTNYFKNILVGGGCWFVDAEVLIFFERGIMKDKLDKNTHSFYLQASYLFHSVWGFVFVFLTSASVCILHRY